MQENGQNQSNPSTAVPIVIIGTDAMLAALPATPVQLAHACLLAGFANVIPVSWGDELIAAAMVRRLAPNGGPVVQCSCPKVAQRLLGASGDLRPVMVPLVSPPVAAARYIRSAAQPTRVHITYVGSCPGAVDDSIDLQLTPEELLATLAEHEIVPEEQPRVFEGVIPPDRRRFRSQPGGLPTSDALWSEHGARSLVEIESDDISTEIAQHIFSGRTVLIDVSARLGCVCAGAVDGIEPSDARHQVVAHEPPRANTPIVNEDEPIDLDLAIPAALRISADAVAVTPLGTDSPGGTSVPDDQPSAHSPSAAPSSTPHGGHAQSPTTPPSQSRISPTPGVPTIADPRPARTTSATPPRPVLGSIPVARGVDGKALPRAYIARRRPSPRSVDAPPPRDEQPSHFDEAQHDEKANGEPAIDPRPAADRPVLAEEPDIPAEYASASDPGVAPAPQDKVIAPTSVTAPPAPTPSTPTLPTTTSVSPAAALAAMRRPVWLVVLLILALIAGIGVGVVVARSLG